MTIYKAPRPNPVGRVCTWVGGSVLLLSAAAILGAHAATVTSNVGLTVAGSLLLLGIGATVFTHLTRRPGPQFHDVEVIGSYEPVEDPADERDDADTLAYAEAGTNS
jgi:hypothetical protein